MSETTKFASKLLECQQHALINLHVNIPFEEVIEGVECLGFEALGQLAIQALFVCLSQKRVLILTSAKSNKVEEMSSTLATFHELLRCLRDIHGLLEIVLRSILELQALHSQHKCDDEITFYDAFTLHLKRANKTSRVNYL